MSEKIILFDLDGTLIDSTDAILHCFDRAFDRYGHDKIDDEKVKELIGFPLDIMFERLGIQREVVWDYVDAYKECYRKISKQKTELLPFAKEAIEEASKFARLGIVTTKTARYSKELLEHMDIMKYFEVLIGRESVENPKPHPEPIQKALKSMKVDIGEDIYMIGDTFLDLESAKRSGVKPVAVLSGYGKESELRKYTDFIERNSLEAVRKILLQYN
jgi:phosphoglycolate phosphatase